MPNRRRQAIRQQRRWGGAGQREAPDFGSNAAVQEEVRPAAPAPARQAAPPTQTAAPTQTVAPARPAAQPQPQSQAPAPALAERMRTGLDPQLTALTTAKKDGDRQTAALSVAGFARDNLTDPKEVQRYLARTDVTATEKTATMGRLAVEAARNEFLAGWAYEGGVGKGGSNGWENGGSNRGAFPSHYQNTVQTYGRSKGAEWCTSFAGAMHQSVGLQTPTGVTGEEANSPFWSGYRLNTWAESGETAGGQQATPVAERVAAGQHGAQYVGMERWSALTEGLKGAKTDADKAKVAGTFTGTHSVQPGDILVLGSGNDYRGNSKSHTVMVETWDPETQTLTTIEGNAGNAVSTRQLDLSDPKDVGTIVSSVRVGFDKYLDPAAQAKIAQDTQDPTVAVAPPITGEALVGQADAVTDRVAAAAVRAGFVNGTAEDSAFVWQHGAAAGDEELSVE
jgi:hypothetical protein